MGCILNRIKNRKPSASIKPEKTSPEGRIILVRGKERSKGDSNKNIPHITFEILTMTISETIKQFLNHCRYSKNLSAHTIKAYSIDFKKFMNFSASKKHISECDVIFLRTYTRHLFKECNLKETSIKRRIASLKVMFRWLELNDIIEINPFHRLDTQIRLPKRLPRGLTRREIRTVIKTAIKDVGVNSAKIYKNKGLLTIKKVKFSNLTTLIAIELLFSTGIRVGELVNITLNDINLKDHTISIVGKGDRERRVFIPGDEIRNLIETYINTRELKEPETNHLLINSRNQPASTQYIRKLIRLNGETANLPQRLTPHMFRHSTATHLLESGVDIRKVQKLLGHQSITTTQIYTHVSDSSLKATIFASHPRNNIFG